MKKIVKLVSMFTLAILVGVPSIDVSQIRAISESTLFEETSKEESEAAENTKEESESIEKETEEQLPVIEPDNKRLNTLNTNTNATAQSYFEFDFGYWGASIVAFNGNLEGAPSEVIIPKSYISNGNETEITRIGSEAFKSNLTITSITIPDSIKTIREKAFQNCSNLINVDLGNGVDWIGEYAFADTGLTSITIPGSIKNISVKAFQNCSNLTNVVLENGIESIGDFAFEGTGLTSITIPDSVKSIGTAAFRISTLIDIDLGNGVESIGDSAFVGTRLTSITIPNSVTRIGHSSFKGTPLTSITIPDSVESIEQRAFEFCSSLTTVDLGNGLKSLGANLFSNSPISHRLHIPSSVESIGARAFEYTKIPMILIDKEKDDLTSSENEPWGLPVGTPVYYRGEFESLEYTIAYNTRFDDVAIDSKTNVNIMESNLLPSNPSKLGYTFKNWTFGTIVVSSSTALEELVTNEVGGSTITLTANWSKENYQIDFEYKGETPKDTPVPKSVTVEYEGILNEPSIAPVNKWTFVGWYSDEACTQLFDFLTGIEENMTLYGVWSYHEDPTPPSNSNSSKSNVKGYVTRTGKKVKVNEIRTSKVMKDLLGNENVITSIKVVDANEPVTVTVNVGKKLSNKNVYIVQLNPNSQLLELISIAQVNKEGEVQFETSSKEEITITTGIPNGFITTVETASTKPMTYFMMENKEFKKGWLKTDSNDYYFFDYKSGEQQKNKWVADGTDTHGYVNWYSLSTDGKMHQSTWIAQDATGAKWYYVNSLGKMVSSTTVDGYIIDVNGVWTK